MFPRSAQPDSPLSIRAEICLNPQINVNSWVRDPYAKALSEGLATKPFPDAQEDATEVFAQHCEKWFKIFGSAGKA